MGKIGIVTLYDLDNYGNRLQNYAVKKVLQKRYGKEVKEINQVNHFLLPKKILNKESESLKRLLKFYKFSSGIRDIEFLCDYNDEEYDYVICGSDQIWNPTWGGNEYTFATFAKKNKRIAYAASFGVTKIPEEKRERYIKCLSEMKAISVREDAGARIVEELTQMNVDVLIDPTLMLNKNEWKMASKRPRKYPRKPYILTYFLGRVDEEYRIYIEEIAKMKNYEIVMLEKENPNVYWNSTGPAEFLWLIENCNLLCTDSFHGSIFSIIMGVPFIVFERKDKLTVMNSRLNTLLNKFHLEDRKYGAKCIENVMKIDYLHIPDILQREKKQVYEFLDNSMNAK